MTKDDIIRMALEAGAFADHMTWVERDLQPVFERFAALVAAQEREECAKFCRRMIEMAIADEREECAKVCELVAINACDKTAQDLSFAIRARGEK